MAKIKEFKFKGVVSKLEEVVSKLEEAVEVLHSKKKEDIERLKHGLGTVASGGSISRRNSRHRRSS